jgi:hypothetical protein
VELPARRQPLPYYQQDFILLSFSNRSSSSLMLHISGTVVLAISVDPQGNVACVQTVSGHPLIIGVAIDSVGHWKFEPYTSQGVKKTFFGQVALRFQANEYGVKYKII